MLYEDSYSFPSHLSAVNEVVILDAVVYGHVVRKGSISRPHEMTVAHAEGKLRTIEHFCEVAQSWSTELRRLSVWRLGRHLLRLVDVSMRIPDCEFAHVYRDLARVAIAKDLPWVLAVRREERLTRRLPIACAAALLSPRLLRVLVIASGRP